MWPMISLVPNGNCARKPTERAYHFTYRCQLVLIMSRSTCVVNQCINDKIAVSLDVHQSHIPCDHGSMLMNISETFNVDGVAIIVSSDGHLCQLSWLEYISDHPVRSVSDTGSIASWSRRLEQIRVSVGGNARKHLLRITLNPLSSSCLYACM